MSTIAFIGGGNMAGCIFDGIVKAQAHDPALITVSGPHPEKLCAFANQGAHITSDNVKAAQDAEIIFLGVKPQVLTSVLQELKDAGIDFINKLVISMAAGYPCSGIKKFTASDRIIRIMPNTPAKIGLGVVGLFCCEGVNEDDKATCHQLLQGLGSIIDTDTEEGINVIGCLAGCAPAFIYRFLEALISEAVAYGFNEKDARRLIEQTAFGSVSMCLANQGSPISALREAVTSKGGTTFEGLKQMTAHNFEGMMADVIKASMDRTHQFEEMFS